MQDYVNSTGILSSIVVKTLTPLLCSCRDGDPLDIKKNLSGNIFHEYGSFEPFRHC
jgi:hypothetical protein